VQPIYLVFALIEGLLVIRFFLRALAANAEAGFAQAIYISTGVLVAPSSVCSTRRKPLPARPWKSPRSSR
jgi:hypothetical protein